MEQKTYSQLNGGVYEHLTVSSYCCPHCREVVKFVVPDDSNLKSSELEIEHYKKLLNSLAQENENLRNFNRRLMRQH